MKIAVVTPYHAPNPAWLAQCHASVRAQTVPCTHILVADGAGPPPLADFSGELIQLQRKHDDYGDTPRAIGWFSAISGGYDAVALLDDDNWLLPEHLASLLRVHRDTRAPVCTSRMDIYTPAGERVGRSKMTDGKGHVDTSCYLFLRPAFGLAPHWVMMPRKFHRVGDFWFWHSVRFSGVRTADSGEATVCYRSTWPGHYEKLGVPVPQGVPMKSVEYQDAQWQAIREVQQHFAEMVERAALARRGPG